MARHAVLLFVPLAMSVVGLAGCQGRQHEAAPSATAAPHADAPPPADGHPPAGAPASAAPGLPAGPPRNAVQAEMRLLNEATRDWVTGIAQNDLTSIPAGIAKVHAARLVTEDALKRGAYVPPKGGAAAVAAFIRQDEAFHDELVRLLGAAKAGDLRAATRQLGVVLDGCTSCHLTFRY